MRVLITGATGYIGSAVLQRLHARGHVAISLARSRRAAETLGKAGSAVVAGHLSNTACWLPAVGDIDAVIHLADTFGSDMASADAAFLASLVPWLQSLSERAGQEVPFLYTGGLWLYGAVGDRTAVEGSVFDPPEDFAWMVEHRERWLQAGGVSLRMVHPAMVWDEQGGVLSEFLEDARRNRAPRITGAATVRWPMVHRDDLAELYCLIMETGTSGTDYHGVAERGVAVGQIANAIARRFSAPAPVIERVEEVVERLGSWAACRAFDQTMEAPATRAALGWSPRHDPVLATIARAR